MRKLITFSRVFRKHLIPGNHFWHERPLHFYKLDWAARPRELLGSRGFVRYRSATVEPESAARISIDNLVKL